MNIRVLTSLVLFTAWLWLLGCENNSPVIDPVSADVLLDASFNGEELSILRGQVVVVTLASNPSTGFTWSVEEVDRPSCVKGFAGVSGRRLRTGRR